jgi:hypothetical protein
MDINSKNIFGSYQNILGSLDFMDEKSVRETLAYILKTYIVDKDISFDGTITETKSQDSPVMLPASGKKYSSFLDMLSNMKKEYEFPELNFFSIEDNKIFVTMQGNKHFFSSVSDKRAAAAPPADKSRPVSPRSGGDADSSDRFNALEID